MLSIIAVSEATAAGAPPRSTGRISARPSAPPWPTPSSTIHSGAAPSATISPSTEAADSATIATRIGSCPARRAASSGTRKAGTIETSDESASRKPAVASE